MRKHPEPWKQSAIQSLIEKTLARSAEASPPRTNAPIIAFYLRRSAADPLFISIKVQLTQCILHAGTLGPGFQADHKVYIDRHRSGASMAGRDGLLAALDDGENGLYSILVISAGCRLARNATIAAVAFERLARGGVEIHLAGKGKLQEYELILLCYSAQRQREGSLEAMKSGHRSAAEDGELFGILDSYGFCRTPDGKNLEIVPNETDVLLDCLHRLDKGDNTYGLARHLYDAGIRTRSGRPFNPDDFFQRGTGLLDRALLKGFWVYDFWSDKPIIIPRPDLAIVPGDLFDRVNMRHGVPRGPNKPRTGPPFLVGLTRCICGKRLMVAESRRENLIKCRDAAFGACDRTTSFSSSVIARDLLMLFRHEILDPVIGRDLEEARRMEWNALDAALRAERERWSVRIAEIAQALDDEAPAEHEEPDPYLVAKLAALEIEHYTLSEMVAGLVMPPFHEIDWSRSEADRARILRMLECMPEVGRSADDVRIIELIRSIVSEIEVDLGSDAYHLRVWFGVPKAPKGCDRFDRTARRWWVRSFPKPVAGPMRYPEVVLGHHKRAESGMLSMSDGDWEAIRPIVQSELYLRKATREMAEALVFFGLAGLGPKYLPERYAPYADRLRNVLRSTVWRRLYKALNARRSPIVASASPAARSSKPSWGKTAHPVPAPAEMESLTAQAA